MARFSRFCSFLFVFEAEHRADRVTWLTAAVDARVVGAAPLVIDVLDMRPNFHNIYRTYGHWPVALKDYIEMNVTRCINCPAFQDLAAIEDPKVYLDRFVARKIPIMAANAVADEFFVPESWQWWYPEYEGEKHLMYIPNAEHSMAGHIEEISNTLSAFLHTLIHGQTRPQVSFELTDNGSRVVIQTDRAPSAVKLWQAYNEKNRAFILNCYLQCWWRPTDLPSAGNNTYIATVDVPETGYLAWLVQLTFDIPGSSSPFVTTTGVSIVPQTFDYDYCNEKCSACDTCLPTGWP